MKNNLRNKIHFIVFFLILAIPLYPKKTLKYAMFVPLILPLIWIIFGGCPLTSESYEENGNKHNFTYNILKVIVPNIKKQLVTYLVTFYCVAIVIICHFRLTYK